MSPMLAEAYLHLNQRSRWPSDPKCFRFFVKEEGQVGLQVGIWFLTWSVEGAVLEPGSPIQAVERGLCVRGGEGDVVDSGLYRPDDLDYFSVLNELRRGFMPFQLMGERLSGEWMLRRAGCCWSMQGIRI